MNEPVWVDKSKVEGLTEITDPVLRAELEEAGFTLTGLLFVLYKDGQLVEVPDREYLDLIKAERALKKPWSVIADFEETAAWMSRQQLSRHPDKDVRPSLPFGEWLKLVERQVLRWWYDPEEDVVPLV